MSRHHPLATSLNLFSLQQEGGEKEKTRASTLPHHSPVSDGAILSAGGGHLSGVLQPHHTGVRRVAEAKQDRASQGGTHQHGLLGMLPRSYPPLSLHSSPVAPLAASGATGRDGGGLFTGQEIGSFLRSRLYSSGAAKPIKNMRLHPRIIIARKLKVINPMSLIRYDGDQAQGSIFDGS